MVGIVNGSFDAVAEEEPFPGVRRRSFDSARATVVRYDFAPGAAFPIHRHPEEQITLVERGDIALTAGSEVHALSAGDYSVMAPDLEHGIRAGVGGARIVATMVPRRDRVDSYTVVG